MGTLLGCQIGLIISNFEYSYQPENAKTFRAIGTRKNVLRPQDPCPVRLRIPVYDKSDFTLKKTQTLNIAPNYLGMNRR